MSETSNNFNQLVALFLAEVIRSRRTSLPRAAEISQRVLNGLHNGCSEGEALKLLNEIEKDFQEITALKQALHFGYSESNVKLYEYEVKEYAAHLFKIDMKLSGKFLQDAASSHMTIQKLCLKYPNFCKFVLSSPEKAALYKGSPA